MSSEHEFRRDRPRNTANLATHLRYPEWVRGVVDINKIPIPESGTVHILDIGGGKEGTGIVQMLQEKLKERADVITADFFRENIDAHPGKQAIVADATDLPFPDGEFDIVVTGELTPDNPQFTNLHHRLGSEGDFDKPQIQNLCALRGEIDRVLKPNGHYVAYHEATYVIPPTYKTVHEDTKMRRIPNGKYLSGLIYGVYAKENPDVGGIDNLFHAMDDITIEKKDRVALWRSLGMLLAGAFRGTEASDASKGAADELSRQGFERARDEIRAMPIEEHLKVVSRIFENTQWVKELTMPSKELQREMYLYHWCAQALYGGEAKAYRWFAVAEHISALPEASPLYQKMVGTIRDSGNDKLVAWLQKHEGNGWGNWED